MYRKAIDSLPCLMKLIHINLLLHMVFFETNLTISRQSELWVISFMIYIAQSIPLRDLTNMGPHLPFPDLFFTLSLYPSENYFGECMYSLGPLQ